MKTYSAGEAIQFHVKGIVCYAESYQGNFRFSVRDMAGNDLLLTRPLDPRADGEQLVSWAEYVDEIFSWEPTVWVKEKNTFVQKPLSPGEYEVYVYEPTQGVGMKLRKGLERVSLGTNMFEALPKVRVIQRFVIHEKR